MKIIMKGNMGADEKDLLTAEIAIMKLVNHPNIIRMEAVYESKKVRTYVLSYRVKMAIQYAIVIGRQQKCVRWLLHRLSHG